MTQAMNASQVVSQIARAVVTNLRTGEVSELKLRPGSRCHFFERFRVGSYNVQLRLDWHDLDKHGHPILDADFMSSDTGEQEHSMNRHPAHHTDSIGSGARTYEWRFEGETFWFAVSITWSLSGQVNSTSAASATMTVIRGSDKDVL